MPKPFSKGIFVFQEIQEGSGGSKRSIKFNPFLIVDYDIWEKTDKETGQENYPDDLPMLAFAEFDFGMEMQTAVDVEHNWLMNGYEGLAKDSSPDDVLLKTLTYDLFHALCHDKQDLNYSYFHWALSGWIKNRAKVQE